MFRFSVRLAPFYAVALFSNLGRYGSAVSAVGGLLTIVIGPVIVRIVCEQVILFFRINETLSDIRSDLQDVKSRCFL